MYWKDCKYLIFSDLRREVKKRREEKSISLSTLFYYYCVGESTKVSVWLRLGTYLMMKKSLFFRMLYIFVKVYYKHIEHKTGIQVPIGTNIGEGLNFFHHGCVVIAKSAIIGNNVSIHQGVTIGRVFSGRYAGVPTIGDNVVIFAGAKILGNIKIGDGAVVGANAVVVKDVPANTVVAGVPAKIISEDSNRCFNKEWGEVFSHGYYE